jgi:uncharacterized protein (DUF362 family)
MIHTSSHLNYDSPEIYDAILNYIESNEKIKNLFKEGSRVLIKPNLCLPQSPEKAITTNPKLIEQVVKIALEKGVNVTLGDGAIGLMSKDTYGELLEITGMNSLAKKYDIELSALDRYGFVNKKFNISNKECIVPISKEYLEADFVINMPKFKTHVLTGFTGSIKNIYGTVRSKIKGMVHGYASSVEDFCKVISEIYMQRIPELTIMDAIDVIEGDGPGAQGKKKHLGLLILGDDGYMVDQYCALLIGLNPDELLTNYYYKELTNSEQDYLFDPNKIKKIEIELPDTFVNRKQLTANFKVDIDPSKCVLCKLCVTNCPQKCIFQDQDQLHIKSEICIRCFCCQEICPEGAIISIMS